MQSRGQRTGIIAQLVHFGFCVSRVRWCRLELSGSLRFSYILMIFSANVGDVYRRFGNLNLECFQSCHYDLRNCEIAKPFVIGGDQEPGSRRAVAFGENLFIGFLVLFPVFALGVIGLAYLPAFGGIIKSLFEALQLLFFTDVQKEFQYVRAVRELALLEVVDLFVPP